MSVDDGAPLVQPGHNTGYEYYPYGKLDGIPTNYKEMQLDGHTDGICCPCGWELRLHKWPFGRDKESTLATLRFHYAYCARAQVG